MTNLGVNFDENRTRAALAYQRRAIGNMTVEGRAQKTDKKPGRVDRARGERISQAMQDRGFYYNCQLCYDINVSESTLSRWRSGLPLSLTHAVSLARALHISLDYLLLGSSPVVALGTLGTQLTQLKAIYRHLDEDRQALLTNLLRSLACQSASGLKGNLSSKTIDPDREKCRRAPCRQDDAG